MIVEEHGKFIVKTHDGKRVLGSHPTRKKAEAQLRAIEASRHGYVPPPKGL